MIVVSASPEGIQRAADAIRQGEVVAYPTETVYGLGVDPFSEDALARLAAVKGRESPKAVLLVIGDAAQLDGLVTSVSPLARAYMDAFWPGPLSLLFPRSPALPEALTGGSDKVCVRCPSSTVARGLCLAVGGPVTSTSANRTGGEPASHLAQVNLDNVAVGVDGGALPARQPSTVYDPDENVIHRPGAIGAEQLEAIRPS